MVKEIPLTRGYVALVDDADFDRTDAHKWQVLIQKRKYSADDLLYARKTITVNGIRSCLWLHHFILDCRDRVDHIDGDGLNCQRSNLRPATQSQNQANRKILRPGTSRFRGVYWHCRDQKWQAKITVNRKYYWLGAFDSEVEAARAYDRAAKTHFGEFANPNFPNRNIA